MLPAISEAGIKKTQQLYQLPAHTFEELLKSTAFVTSSCWSARWELSVIHNV